MERLAEGFSLEKATLGLEMKSMLGESPFECPPWRSEYSKVENENSKIVKSTRKRCGQGDETKMISSKHWLFESSWLGLRSICS